MNFVSSIVVFVCIWWIVMFCVLPIGLSGQPKDYDKENMAAPGAPDNPQIKKKVLLTTAISLVLWVISYMIISSGLIDFREMSENL